MGINLVIAVTETPGARVLNMAGRESAPVEVQGMENKNLAMEALRKLINGEIHSPLRSLWRSAARRASYSVTRR